MENKTLGGVFMENKTLGGVFMENRRDTNFTGGEDEILADGELMIEDMMGNSSTCTLEKYPGWLAVASVEKIVISILGILGQYQHGFQSAFIYTADYYYYGLHSRSSTVVQYLLECVDVALQ